MPPSILARKRRGAFAFARWDVIIPILTNHDIEADVFVRMRCTCREWRKLLEDAGQVALHLRSRKALLLSSLAKYQGFRRVTLQTVVLRMPLQQDVARNVYARNAFVYVNFAADIPRTVRSMHKGALGGARVVNFLVRSLRCMRVIPENIDLCQRFFGLFAIDVAGTAQATGMMTLMFGDLDVAQDVMSTVLLARVLSIYTGSRDLRLEVRLHVARRRLPPLLYTQDDLICIKSRNRMRETMLHGWRRNKRIGIALSVCHQGTEPFNPFPRMLQLTR